MPTTITKEQVKTMQSQGTLLVEVLSAKQYQQRHIAGAVNIPLEDLDEAATQVYGKDRPIITYCADYQ
jgi:rhodanese-related sulfurtransferase